MKSIYIVIAIFLMSFGAASAQSFRSCEEAVMARTFKRPMCVKADMTVPDCSLSLKSGAGNLYLNTVKQCEAVGGPKKWVAKDTASLN